MLSKVVLNPKAWAKLPLNLLSYVYDDEWNPTATPGADAYQPLTRLPTAAVCRLSESEKRLENGTLDSRVMKEAPWGIIHDIQGGGGNVGIALEISPAVYHRAHASPDGLHLVCREALSGESILKSAYEAKTLRVFLLGAKDSDSGPHDLLLTAKTRWFRNRINPKFLGFSKDEKL